MAVDKTKDIQVGGTLHSIATGNIIAHADEIMDEDYGKKQSVINQELNNRLPEELKGYLPLSGGIMSGNITFPNTLGILIQNKTNTDLLNAGGGTTSISNLAGQATLSGFSESTESNENLEIETTDTINQGFGKLQKAIKDNELTIAQALNAFKDNVGLLDLNASLPDMSSTHYMTNATTIVECLQALDSKLYEVEQALTLKTV